MAFSSRSSVISQAIVDLLKDTRSLQVHDIFYGDQNAIPRVPTITVEPAEKRRRYNQTGLQTNVDLEVAIMVYHARITDLQVSQKELDERTEAIEDALHANTTLDGLVINGLVESIVPGFVTRGREVFIGSRLTWTAVVKERIGV